jgi:hypothetical protein
MFEPRQRAYSFGRRPLGAEAARLLRRPPSLVIVTLADRDVLSCLIRAAGVRRLPLDPSPAALQEEV